MSLIVKVIEMSVDNALSDRLILVVLLPIWLHLYSCVFAIHHVCVDSFHYLSKKNREFIWFF